MLEGKRLISVPQLAKLLGVKPQTIYKWAKQSKMTYIRVGGPSGRIWIEPSDAADMVKVHERKEMA